MKTIETLDSKDKKGKKSSNSEKCFHFPKNRMGWLGHVDETKVSQRWGAGGGLECTKPGGETVIPQLADNTIEGTVISKHPGNTYQSAGTKGGYGGALPWGAYHQNPRRGRPVYLEPQGNHWPNQGQDTFKQLIPRRRSTYEQHQGADTGQAIHGQGNQSEIIVIGSSIIPGRIANTEASKWGQKPDWSPPNWEAAGAGSVAMPTGGLNATPRP